MECTSVYSVPVLYVHIVETRLVWMSGGRIWPGGMRPANTENLAWENEFARMIQINSDTHGLTICAYPSVSSSYKYLVPISYSITNPVAYLKTKVKQRNMRMLSLPDLSSCLIETSSEKWLQDHSIFVIFNFCTITPILIIVI